MNKQQAKEFIQEFVKLRELATDEMSVQVPTLYPEWKSDVVYTTGQRVTFEGTLYKVLQDHTSQETWIPSNVPSLFAQVLIPDENVIPEWIQPDSTNPYMQGDRVTFDGKIWESGINNNVWKPGEYGWNEFGA